MMDPDHQSLDPDPELESPDIPKRVEIRHRSRIQGRNRNTSTPYLCGDNKLSVMIDSITCAPLSLPFLRPLLQSWPKSLY